MQVDTVNSASIYGGPVVEIVREYVKLTKLFILGSSGRAKILSPLLIAIAYAGSGNKPHKDIRRFSRRICKQL